ncbi:protein kinase domain protein [Plakobranchus ocellatus]|uniref:Protein kinase domain protein n=1 Tax=Plakobranchus ocellatus TaxID=259542 RepID=A0AAV4BF07_9GAST|nr:protein kinase domain protein [Plakobranchus ocellatus]
MEACGNIPAERLCNPSPSTSDGPNASGPTTQIQHVQNEAHGAVGSQYSVHPSPQCTAGSLDIYTTTNEDQENGLMCIQQSLLNFLQADKENSRSRYVRRRLFPKNVFNNNTHTEISRSATTKREPFHSSRYQESSGRHYSHLNVVYNPVVSDISSDGSMIYEESNNNADALGQSLSNRPHQSSPSGLDSTDTAMDTDALGIDYIRSKMLDQLHLKQMFQLSSTNIRHVVLCEYKTSPLNKVVVKFYPKDSTRFSREVAALKRLKHPWIIKMVASESCLHQQALVLHFCYHGRLTNYIDKFDFKKTVGCIYQIISAVHYIHGHHTIHGDIKLDNILLDGGFDPHLSDFDLAEYLPPGKLLVRGRRGTCGFIAPEMNEDPKGLHDGYKTDAYSLGAVILCVLFERKFKPGVDLYYLAKKSHYADTVVSGPLK